MPFQPERNDRETRQRWKRVNVTVYTASFGDIVSSTCSAKTHLAAALVYLASKLLTLKELPSGSMAISTMSESPGTGDHKLIVGTPIPTLGTLLLGPRLVLFFDHLELVEQSLVADFKDSSSLAAVPARLRQHPFNGFALCRHGSATANLQQRRCIV